MSPNPQPPLWITEADVASLMDLGEAIEALERGLRASARGEAENMVKTHVAWGSGSTLHAIGATFPSEGIAGTKTWAHTERGATPLLVLFDSDTGELRAVIEAFVLGQMRTGAASGVATRYLAAEGATELALVGTGKQSLAQAAAVAAVRPIRRVRVFGRDPGRLAQCAARIRQELGIETAPAESVEAAVAGAPIVTVVTRAAAPILSGHWLDRGCHVNAVGAIVPTRAELEPDVLARATRIVVDSVASARKLAKELIDFFAAQPDGWARVESLASLVATGDQRAGGDDVTVFKSLGMGISDLSLGIVLYRKAVAKGLGRRLETPQRAQPRLRVAPATRDQGA